MLFQKIEKNAADRFCLMIPAGITKQKIFNLHLIMRHLLKIFLLLTAALFLSQRCRKVEKLDPDTSDAVITGFDFSECGCCGGFIVNIINNPPYSNDFLARELPAGSGINSGADFPVYVKIEWHADTTECERRIIITKLLKK